MPRQFALRMEGKTDKDRCALERDDIEKLFLSKPAEMTAKLGK